MRVNELLSKYSKNDLVTIWENLYKIRCTKNKADDIAWGIWQYCADMERTRDLTKNFR